MLPRTTGLAGPSSPWDWSAPFSGIRCFAHGSVFQTAKKMLYLFDDILQKPDAYLRLEQSHHVFELHTGIDFYCKGLSEFSDECYFHLVVLRAEKMKICGGSGRDLKRTLMV